MDNDTSTTTDARPLTGDEQVDSILNAAQVQYENDIGNDLSESTPPTDPTAQRFRIKVGGEEQEVSLQELVSGYNRHSDYTRKTQELAEQRRQLEAMQRALFESDAMKALKAMAEKETGEFDPYNPDSMLEHLRKQVAEQLASMYRPVEEAYASETAKVKVRAFMDGKPEFQDDGFKAEVRDLLKVNQSLTLEDAYWIAKGKRDSTARSQAEEEAARYRKALAEAGLKVGTGSNVGQEVGPPKAVRERGAVAIAEWFARNKGSW